VPLLRTVISDMLRSGPCGERKQLNTSIGVVDRILPERPKILGMIILRLVLVLSGFEA
jgi:hypothetical protein